MVRSNSTTVVGVTFEEPRFVTLKEVWASAPSTTDDIEDCNVDGN